MLICVREITLSDLIRAYQLYFVYVKICWGGGGIKNYDLEVLVLPILFLLHSI